MIDKNKLNIKGIICEYKYIIIAFFATAITMITIFLCNKMIPFGDNTILRMDLYHQYGPLFAELYERITNSDSLIYSWTSGLGSCFLGNYFNYLSSPLGFLIFFFDHKDLTEAIAVMILVKAALSASTFTYYIKRSLHSQNYVSVAFGVMYSFCGYMLAYYWNVMWLDAMVLLPIVLLGVERIIDHGKMKTFVISLALTMFSNYYMSYMLCIFSVIYFIYYYFIRYSVLDVVDKKIKNKLRIFNYRFLRSGIIFAVAALTAAGLMACVLVPVYQVLKSSSATSNTFPTQFISYFSFYDFFANHLANLTTTIRSSGDHVLPNVYCGILTLILAPLYFFTKSISKKEKFATLALLSVLLLSFNINYLNYIWHGFHYPNDLPYRQSFIYSFVLLVIAYKTFVRAKEFTTKHFAAVGVGLLLFVMLVQEMTSKNVSASTVTLTIILIVLYVCIISIFLDKKFHAASVAALLVICVCSEAVMCDSNTVSISVKKDSFVAGYDEFQNVKDKIDTIEGDDFYRMELTDLRTRMDNSWLYYNGVSVFSSMASEKMSKLQDRLGMMSNTINSYTYNPQTPVYNMMFSLDYIVNNTTPDLLAASPNYEKVYSYSNYTAYKNNYSLPIAYLVDSNVAYWASEDYIEKWNTNTVADPFALQGDYFNLATGGLGSPFRRLYPAYIDYSNIAPFTESINSSTFYFDKTNDSFDGAAVFTLVPETDSNIYIYFEVSGSSARSITVTSSLGTMAHSVNQSCILDLGYHNANETITVNLPLEAASGTIKFVAYTLDEETFITGYEHLKNQQVLIEEFNDTSIKGRFTATEDCMVYTSIPYDTAWQVYIDGEKVSSEKVVSVGGALIGVMVERGNHNIEFRYEFTALYSGLLITVMTVLAITAFYLIKLLYSYRKKKSKRKAIRYADIDLSYSTKIFLPVKKKADLPAQSVVEVINISDLSSSDYPRREIILPPKKEVTGEIISPTSDNCYDPTDE